MYLLAPAYLGKDHAMDGPRYLSGLTYVTVYCRATGVRDKDANTFFRDTRQTLMSPAARALWVWSDWH